MASREYKAFYKGLIQKAIPADLSDEEIRAFFEAWMADYLPPSDVRFEPFSLGSLPASWVFAPGTEQQQKIILFFHGGAYTAGSTRSHAGMLGYLSKACGASILSIDYRLSPEFPFPAALEDALSAYRWLLHHPYPPSHIALAGISAGAGLLLALCLKLKLEKTPLPKALLCFAPWVDLAMKAKSIQANKGKDILTPNRIALAAQKYAQGRDLKDPLLSPLYGDLRGLPPLFIQSGDLDLIHDESLMLKQAAKQQGVKVTLDVWPEMVHAWPLFVMAFPEAREALERAGEFFRSHFR